MGGLSKTNVSSQHVLENGAAAFLEVIVEKLNM